MGRRTELCSRQVVTAWSPGESTLEISRFKASVTLCENTSRLGSLPPKKAHSFLRASASTASASSARSNPVRPGLTPRVA